MEPNDPLTMNYRHAFHAGNFADVVKHAVLTRIIAHLLKKDTAFRVLDTHAGAGLYDLGGPEASRSGEWREGIHRLLAAKLDPAIQELLDPYLDAVRTCNPPGELICYPGSPALVRSWLRARDRLIACELEPKTAALLLCHFRGDRQIKTIGIDGWTALSAFIPPKERRGLVLVDAPFEEPGEFTRLANALIEAQRKWPTGIYLAWYPIKEPREVTTFTRELSLSSIPNVLRVELTIGLDLRSAKLRGSGLIVINPPWTLENELRLLLPALGTILAHGETAATRLDWLSGDGK